MTPTPRWVISYVKLLSRARFLVLVFWLTLGGLGGWKAFDFLGLTTFDTSNIPSSLPSIQARYAFGSHFPGPYGMDVLAVLLRRKTEGAHILGPDVQGFTTELYDGICEAAPYDSKTIAYYESVYLSVVNNEPVENLNRDFVSKDNRTALITIRSADWDSEVRLIDVIQRVGKGLADKHFPDKDVEVMYTGDPNLFSIIGDALEGDLLIADSLSLPAAFFIFCITLKSIRVVLLPLLSLIISTLTTFLLLLPIAMHTNVSSVASNLVMCLATAMSIDYSLFLMKRYREEIRRGRPPRTAIATALDTSGRTIFVSASTLILCSASLIFFPLDLLRSLGYSASICVFVCMFVNLTFSPALLLTFENFFRNSALTYKSCRPIPSGNTGINERYFIYNEDGKNDDVDTATFREQLARFDDDEEVTALLSADDTDRFPTTPGRSPRAARPGFDAQYPANEVENEEMERVRIQRSGWYRFGAAVLRYPLITVVLVFGLSAGLTVPVVNFHRAGGVMCFTPSNSPAMKAYNAMGDAFGKGRTFPYAFVAVGKPGDALTLPFAEAVVSALEDIAAIPGASLDSFTGLYYANGEATSYDAGLACIGNDLCATVAPGCSAICAAYKTYVDQSMQQSATFFWTAIQPDPWSFEGTTWLREARRVLAERTRNTGIGFFLARSAAEDIDLTNLTYEKIPMAVGCIIAIVFIIMAITFRSLMIPVKAILSIFLTLSIVYGLAVLVYQEGIFSFTKLFAVQSMNALCWINPLLCLPLLVGLALDYEIFLLARIAEYRLERMDDKHAILFGLASTGRLITYAGLIMAFAFLGLALSKEAILCQLSFFMVIAVLVDTFLVRACVVPSVMILMGRMNWNWWPRKMPTPVVMAQRRTAILQLQLSDPTEDF